MKGYDETPWWCQLLWPWFGPPWYAEIEDPDACLDAIRRQFAQQAGELAGDARPGEGQIGVTEIRFASLSLSRNCPCPVAHEVSMLRPDQAIGVVAAIS